MAVLASSFGAEVISSNDDAQGDFAVAGRSFGVLRDDIDDSAWISTDSSCVSGSFEGLNCLKLGEDKVHKSSGSGKKKKRVIATTGMVSSVLGKEYVTSGSRKGSERYDNVKDPMGREDMEQFLCSMLGDESHLNMGVVRDVMWHCGFNFEKALEALLKLCGSSRDKFEIVKSCHNKETVLQAADPAVKNCTDGASDTTSCSSEREILDDMPCIKLDSGRLNKVRTYAEVLCGSRASSHTTSNMSDLPLNVLQSLFNFSMTSGHDSSTVNWRNIVNKLELLGKGCCSTACAGSPENAHVMHRKDEYQMFRKDAVGHWESMRSYYKKAASAHSRDRRVAAFLADQGRVCREMAQEAEEKASRDIFSARNRGIGNIITIDLHGQHVKQALHLLKAHLLFGMWISSIQYIRVITGSGIHGVGKSKLKLSVIGLLKEEEIEWVEENSGTLLIKLEGPRELKFFESNDGNE